MAGEPQQPGAKTPTFDLSTLGLSAGSHTITVKARASGYADSEPSNAVSYTVEGETTTVSGTWEFNETIDVTRAVDYVVRFTSNNTAYTGISMGKGVLYVGNPSIEVYPYVSGEGFTGWINETYRTITFDGVQTVSKEFYDWFTANAVQQTVTISGTWRFNTSPAINANISQWVSISSCGGSKTYSGIACNKNPKYISYIYGDGTGYEAYYPDRTYYNADGWSGEEYKTVVIRGSQDVSVQFYEWLTANATQTDKHPEET